MRVPATGIAVRAREVGFTFDGAALTGYEGESLAAALAAQGRLALRRTRAGEPRGVFCGMGVCFDCLVAVDGEQNLRACLTPLAAGMRVETQETPGRLPAAAAPPPDDAEPEEVVERPDVLVVGGGPAGLQAARAAALCGAGVTLLDERPAPGGQYFKQLAKVYAAADAALDAQMREGRELIEEVRALGVRMIADATVWGAFKPREIAVLASGRSLVFEPGQLVLATGAYERGVPVPGWTLPGFMTTGAAQTLLRAYRVAPGRRVLVAGNGPLNFQLAVELLDAGVEVACVVEAAPRPGWAELPALAAAWRHAPGLMAQGLEYLRRLREAGVEIRFGQVVTGAEGDGRVQRVTVGPATRSFEVDAVCAGYGFLPVNELARALGCAHAFDSARGYLVTEADAERRTGKDGIYVAGDGGGMGGSRAAQEQGFIAGLAAARALGRPVPPQVAGEAARRRRRLASHAAFQAALWRLFRAPAIGERLAAPDTTLCRCEEVPLAAVRDAVAEGATMAGAVKRLTRAGMGRCQGRYCGPLVAEACARATGTPLGEFSMYHPRPPTKSVPIAALARRRPDPVASDGTPR